MTTTPGSPNTDLVPQATVDLAATFEGFSSRPYKDPGYATWTIGYGSIWVGGDPARGHVNGGTPTITEAEARKWLMVEMVSSAKAVDDFVKVPLTVAERAALIDFVYNLGPAALEHSTLGQLLNAGNYAEAAARFMDWVMGGGRVLPGLVRRRQAERDLFVSESPPYGDWTANIRVAS